MKTWNNYFDSQDFDNYFETFLDGLRDGLMLNEVLCGEDGKLIDIKILKINNVFEDLFCVCREEIIGKSISEAFNAINQEWFDIYGQIAYSGQHIQKEMHSARTDKHFRLNIFCPVHGQLVVMFTDITEIIKAEEALKKHFILFENAKDIIFYLKSNGIIIDANKTAVEHYGYPKEELLNMKLQQLRAPFTMKDFEYQMEMSATKGITFESTHIKQDGTTFPVEVSSRTIDINGELMRIHIVRDITERKKAEEEIRFLANYDALTNIPNRGFLMSQFEKILLQAAREKFRIAVLLFDVDKFKYINDTYGHNVGDEVLKEVAQRLKMSVRSSDIFGRLGGDEFLIVQPFIKHKNDAAALAQKLIDNMNHPLNYDGLTIDIKISIGISFYPHDADNVKDLIFNADNAMYSAKQNGGNAYNTST